MNKDKEFVPYEQALALKELGFDKPCFGYWRNENLPNPITIGQYTTKEDMEYEISGQDEYHNFENIIALAPLYQQAFRWFREKYELRNSITDFIDDKTGIEWDYEIAIIGTDLDEKGNYKPLVDYSTDDETRKFKTYEEAELACLIKLIELVKNK